jgi:hypothetical protein
LALLASLSFARVARAEEPAADPLSGDATWRVALLPTVGVGFAHIGKSDIFPNDVGTTFIGGEADAAYERFGALARLQFLSSGNDGHWTAMSYGLGGSYRLFGDGYDSLALYARGGLLYEHWRVTNGGCRVILFFPLNCKALLPPAESGVTVTQAPVVHYGNDAFGIFGGARIELPIHGFFVAFDAEVAPLYATGDLPSVLLQARLAIVVGLKNRRATFEALSDPSRAPRAPRGGGY